MDQITSLPDLKRIDGEIRKGLPHEKARLDEARINLDFYHGDFEPYQDYLPITLREDRHSDRPSLIMQRVVNLLTEHLYRANPIRTVQGRAEATAWLERVYRHNGMFARWQQADRLAVVNEVSAFQVSGSDDPECPVKISLWGADQFAVFCDPDDPTCPQAVVTIDVLNGCQRRYTLFTEELIRVYLTDAMGPLQTAGGTVPRLVSEAPNPYRDEDGKGILPFAFVHFTLPYSGFWTPSPGTSLRKANDHINVRLYELAEHMRRNRPFKVAEGVGPLWTEPRPLMPGDTITLPSVTVDQNGQVVKPNLNFVQPDLHFCKSEWDDISNYQDHLFESLGIPPAAFRMVANAARSGISLLAEQLPIVFWARGRQQQFAHYEARLARLVLMVGASHLRSNGRDAADLEVALRGFNLAVRYHDLMPELPGPERDRADQFAMEQGFTSKLMLIEKRDQLTRDEAIAHAKQVQQDDADWEAVFGPGSSKPDPTPVPMRDTEGAVESDSPATGGIVDEGG